MENAKIYLTTVINLISDLYCLRNNANVKIYKCNKFLLFRISGYSKISILIIIYVYSKITQHKFIFFSRYNYFKLIRDKHT